MVMSITAAKTAKEITQYNHTIVPPIAPTNIKMNNINDMIPAPKNNPIAAMANPLSLPLARKAIKANKPKTNAVIPKVMPNKNQGMKTVIDDNATPINIE